MKKILTVLGLMSVLTLGAVGVNGYVSANAEETGNSAQPMEETWDAVETFDNEDVIDDKFDFYFCSSQNARRGDELAYSWDVKDGAIYRTGNIDSAADTVNIAIMSYVSEVYDDFELSVDFKAGSLTAYWPVIGIRQQIPGKNYTVEGGGAGVFMQQDGKITLWGPIINGNTLGNLYEEAIPNISTYYSLMWHTMRIRAEGSSVKVWVDETEVANITVNATDYSKGYISLISVNNDCAFDNFKVRGLGGSSQKGNETNKYEHADLGQGLDDIIANGYTGVKLPEESTSTTLGAPTVSPTSQQAIVDENDFAGVKYTVNYNNGDFVSLKLNGLEVAADNYTRSAATLIFEEEYITKLPVGDNEFTLTTTGGTAEFTLSVQREKVVFTDSIRIKKFSMTDVSFKMDFGVGAVGKVTLGGAILPASAYTYQNGALRIKRDFLKNLETGVYEVFVYDQKGNYVDCVVTVGVEPSQAFVINHDSFVVEGNGYAQDLTASEQEDGLYGNGGGITCNGAGTLLIMDKDNINYAFQHGTTYSVTTYLKFNNTVAGTSSFLDLLMPIFFTTAAGNADIGYIRYNADSGYYFTPEAQCAKYVFVKVGDWYRLTFAFTYDSSWTRMEMPVWMVTDFTMDNFVLAPISVGESAKLPKELSVPKNTDEDIVIDCAEKVVGINYNGEALTADDYTYANGQITFKKEFLSSLSSGKNTVSVYCTNSFHDIVIDVNLYALSISGNTAYTLNGGDMTLTVETDTFTLASATISDSKKTLEENVDYVVNGNQLVLKESYLLGLVSSERLTIIFGENATLEFVITTSKLLAVDFENGGLDKGFAVGMTQETVNGKDGNGMKLSNTSSATMLSLGGEFYDVTFEAGKSYTFSFDLKIENIDTTNNFVIAGNSCWMPITFGSGKDVTYLRVVKEGDVYKIFNEAQQVGFNTSVGQADSNGFMHLEFSFIPTAACTNLTFDVWMPSTIVIDNVLLIAN